MRLCRTRGADHVDLRNSRRAMIACILCRRTLPLDRVRNPHSRRRHLCSCGGFVVPPAAAGSTQGPFERSKHKVRHSPASEHCVPDRGGSPKGRWRTMVELVGVSHLHVSECTHTLMLQLRCWKTCRARADVLLSGCARASRAMERERERGGRIWLRSQCACRGTCRLVFLHRRLKQTSPRSSTSRLGCCKLGSVSD